MSMGTDNDGAQVDPAQKASGISLLKGILTLLGGASGATTVWGTTADAAVVTDTTGTISGKLRGLVKWAFERMPAALGQTTMAASLPVTIASNQSALSVDSELPAAAALADATANPTIPSVGADLLVFNGTTWDRLRVPSRQVDLNAVAITTIATLYTPAAGKKIRLISGSISVSAACSVLFEDNSAGNGTAFRTPQLLANTPYNFLVTGGQGYRLALADSLLKGTASTGTVTITGTLQIAEE